MINYCYFLNIIKLVYVLPHTAACNTCPVHASHTWNHEFRVLRSTMWGFCISSITGHKLSAPQECFIWKGRGRAIDTGQVLEQTLSINIKLESIWKCYSIRCDQKQRVHHAWNKNCWVSASEYMSCVFRLYSEERRVYGGSEREMGGREDVEILNK